MFNLFNKERKKDNDQKNISLLAIASILIHSAKIDEKYTEKEKKIIQSTLIEIGAKEHELHKLLEEAEKAEADANQLIYFTQTIKKISEDEKKIIIEALWKIIYSDENVDVYEDNLMRRLCGLLYLDKKIVGDIKEKIKIQKI